MARILGVMAFAGLLGGAAEVFIINWLTVHGPTWGTWSLAGNGALIVPLIAFPIYILVGALLTVKWRRQHASVLAVSGALLLYAVSIPVGGVLASLLWSAVGFS